MKARYRRTVDAQTTDQRVIYWAVNFEKGQTLPTLEDLIQAAREEFPKTSFGQLEILGMDAHFPIADRKRVITRAVIFLRERVDVRGVVFIEFLKGKLSAPKKRKSKRK